MTPDDNRQVPEKSEQQTVDYSVSQGFFAVLSRHSISVAISSYQSSLLYVIGRNPGSGVNVHQAVMPKPMGLVIDDNGGLLLAAGHQLIRF